MEIEPLGAYLPFPRAPFSGAQWEQAGSLTSWDMPVIGLKPGSKPVGYTLSFKMGVQDLITLQAIQYVSMLHVWNCFD